MFVCHVEQLSVAAAAPADAGGLHCFSSCVSGGLFSKTEMSEVLTEILKVDPSFDKDSFLKQCERDIIPNILEVCLNPSAHAYLIECCARSHTWACVLSQAMIRGELEVLKDWCYEAVRPWSHTRSVLGSADVTGSVHSFFSFSSVLGV